MGKRPTLNATISFVAVLAVMLLSMQGAGSASARVVQVPGAIITDTIHANEGVVVYNFTRDNQYVVSADVDVSLTLSIGIPLELHHVNVTINASSDLILFFENSDYFIQFVDSWFEEDDDGDGNLTRYTMSWGSYAFFQFDKTGGNMSLGVPVGSVRSSTKNYTITATDKWTVYQNGSWHVLPTTLVNNRWLVSNVSITQNSNFFSIFASNETEMEPEDPPVNPPNDDYEAILSQERARATMFASVGAVIGIVVAVVAAISFTSKEYRDYIKAKATHDIETHHKLTIDEVLENENRVLIIDAILHEPGIHFNELMRKTSLAPGNLVWHLEILCNYKVIGKKSIGQYMVYYPFSPANPLKDIDITLVKSKVTLQILNIIENEPGIYGNVIAKRLGLDHKTIKYHVDKLVDAKLIVAEKEGRTRKLTPRLRTTLDVPPRNP